MGLASCDVEFAGFVRKLCASRREQEARPARSHRSRDALQPARLHMRGGRRRGARRGRGRRD